MMTQAAPAWQRNSHVLEVVQYAHDFRDAHEVDLQNPRSFSSDEMGDMGQLVLGSLVITPEFQREWADLADPETARRAAEFCRGVRPRLEVFKLRRKTMVA